MYNAAFSIHRPVFNILHHFPNMSSLRSGTSSQRINYIACGPEKSKTGVICVHGWACQASDYKYLFDELVKHGISFQAIAISLPGHRGSSTNSYPAASIPAFAKAVTTFINELEIPKVILCGHSMGVRVILETWQQIQSSGKPNVKGLVFLDGSHYKFRKSLFAFDSGDARSKSLSQEQRAEKIAEAFTRMFSPKTPPDFQASTIAHVKALDPEYNKAMRDSFIRYDYERMDDVLEEVGKAGLPVLNLQATNVDEENQRIPLKPGEDSRWMRFVREKVPQVKMVVVGESMHFPHVDQPVEVTGRVREFLRELLRELGV